MAKEGLKIRDQLSLTPFGATNPINSRGNEFTTVQGAIDDLEDAGVGGFVWVPVGTFSEALTITGNDITLLGAGWSSIIDGGTTGHAVNITGSRCVVRDLQVKTTPGEGNAFRGIEVPGGTNSIILRVYVNGSDEHGISSAVDTDMSVIQCFIDNTDASGISPGGAAIIKGNRIENAGVYGINLKSTADNSVVVGNIIDTTGDDGIFIHADAENCVVVANRITNWTNEAIGDDSGTGTVGNNNIT